MVSPFRISGYVILWSRENRSGEYKAELSIVVPPADRQFNNLGNGYDSYLECIAAGRLACFGSPTVRTMSRRPPIVAHANVTVSVSPPAFLRAPENVTVLDGMDAQLSCSVVGGTTAKHKLDVQCEGRMQILESGTLVIASVVLADSGKYTCVRANSAGSASAEAYLTVLEDVFWLLPTAPRRLAVSNIGPFSVMLQFTPGFDGNTSITRWIVEAQTRRSEQWIPVHEVTAKATSSTTVVVSWGPVPRAHRSGVLEGYRVVYQAARESAPMRKHIESNATFTTTLTELRKYTTYTVQVLAYTRVGDGALSLPPVAVTTFEDAPQVAPTNVVVTPYTTTSITVVWKIFYKAEGDAEEAMEAVPATPTAYTITDLRRFTKYSVQLLAFNPAGDGPRSKPLQVHTQADLLQTKVGSHGNLT
ncbi:hypothetical protein MTO96_021173 [Rhipicephalus appendiculatus]